MSKEQKETIISINSNGMPMDKRDELNRKNRLYKKILTDLIIKISESKDTNDENVYGLVVKEEEYELTNEEYELIKELVKGKKERKNANANKQQKD